MPVSEPRRSWPLVWLEWTPQCATARIIPSVVRSVQLIGIAAALATLAACGGEPTAPDAAAKAIGVALHAASPSGDSLRGLTSSLLDPGLCDNGSIYVVCCPGPPQVARESVGGSGVSSVSNCIDAPPGISPSPIPPPPAPPSPGLPPGNGGPPDYSPPPPGGYPPPPGGGGYPGGGGGGEGCQAARATFSAYNDPVCPGDPLAPQYDDFMPGPSDPDAFELPTYLPEVPPENVRVAANKFARFDCTVRNKCPHPRVYMESPEVRAAILYLSELARAAGPGIEYGAWIFRRRDGSLFIGPAIRGVVGQVPAMDSRNPANIPARAVGSIHVHPSDYGIYSDDFLFADDRGFVIGSKVIAVIASPKVMWVLNADGSTWNWIHREPPGRPWQ